MPETVPFTEAAVLEYLDDAITSWRVRRNEALTLNEELMAVHYVDAYQSVRRSIFGELKPPENFG